MDDATLEEIGKYSALDCFIAEHPLRGGAPVGDIDADRDLIKDVAEPHNVLIDFVH